MANFNPAALGETPKTHEGAVKLYDAWAGAGNYDADLASWGYEAPQRVAEYVTESARACSDHSLSQVSRYSSLTVLTVPNWRFWLYYFLAPQLLGVPA